MRTLTLNTYGTVTLNGSGNGTVQLGPTGVTEIWHPGVASVSCNQQTANGTCTCSIYVGPAAYAGYLVGATVSGDFGDSLPDVSATTIRAGYYIIAVWSGGVPGALATLSINGSRTVP